MSEQVSEKATRPQNANLVNFKPGQSGNPAGMPKGVKHGIAAVLRRELRKKTYPEVVKAMKSRGIELEDGTHTVALVHALIQNGLQGETQAIKLIHEIEKADGPLNNTAKTIIYNVLAQSKPPKQNGLEDKTVDVTLNGYPVKDGYGQQEKANGNR